MCSAPVSQAFSIVTLGDSITDGVASTLNTNTRWPNFLAQNLLSANISAGVLDEGIGLQSSFRSTRRRERTQPIGPRALRSRRLKPKWCALLDRARRHQ